MECDEKYHYLVQRVEAFRDLLRDEKLEGFLLTHLSDLVYFTDYRTEGYYGLIGLKDSWLFLPNLLFDHGRASTCGFICLKGPFFQILKQTLKKSRLKKVGFDPDQLPYSFGTALLKMGFVPRLGLITRLRVIKDALELTRMRRANQLAAEGAQYVKNRLKPGIREKQVAADLARFFSIKGDGLAFDTIIAAGANSAFPHHITSDRKMKKGEPVICDLGAMCGGYRSDLTRTYTLGKIKGEFSRIFSIVEKAQKEGIQRLKPGVTAGSVDLASRRYIQKRGYGRYFVHSTGHGVGLDIHENPRIGPGAKDILKTGMVVTVEPGIYLPGKYGVRIEDTLLVTLHGHEILTKV